MMRVHDYTKLCGGYKRWSPLAARQGIMVHRIDVGETAGAIAHRFETDLKEYTGGDMPYTFVIRRDGQIDQALRLEAVSPHAGREHSCQWLAVGVIGNFTEEEPTQEQWQSLVQLCVAHSLAFGGFVKVVGHDEVPGASKDPTKECPGEYLNMDYLRELVAAELATSGFDMLRECGVVL